MDEYYFSGSRVPAFGSWGEQEGFGVEGLPFTECFDRARQARFLRYCTYSQEPDLYVPTAAGGGDLYHHHHHVDLDDDDDVAPPPMILVPRRKVKQGKRGRKEAWVVCDGDDMEVKEPPSPLTPSPPRRPPKAVDEDLYKISPELLYAKSTRRRKWGFLSSCLQPSCVQ